MKKYLISFISFLIAITLTGCSGVKTNKVDLNKAVSVEITGCDGYGEGNLYVRQTGRGQRDRAAVCGVSGRKRAAFRCTGARGRTKGNARH